MDFLNVFDMTPVVFKGIIAGIIVFTFTIISVIVLLFKGGSIERIKEQVKFLLFFLIHN